MADDGPMSVFAKFGLDVTDFLGGLEKSQSGILAFYRDVSVSIGATMFVFDKLMAYGQQFIELANKASEFVSTLDKLSVTTGLNNEELQRWSNVARYADSDVSTLSASLRKFQLNLNDSGESGEKVRKILDSMGVSYKNADGSLKSMTELFPDAITGIGNLSSSADRVTASNALFGRSYQELAGYMTMSKSEMEGYYQSANVLTEDQQQKLRDYEQACKDLNGTLQALSYTAGSDLAPSMKEWTDLLNNDILQSGGAVDTFFSDLNGFLTDVARGFHIMGVEAGAAWKLVHGDVSGAIQDQKDLAAWVQYKQSQDALSASGYSEGMVWDAASGKWVKPASSGTGSKLSLPEPSKSPESASTKSETVAKAATTAWSDTAVVGSAGSEMYLFMMQEMAAGTDYQTALNNWSAGTHTVTNREGTLGAAKAQGASTAGTAVSATKILSPADQATADTGTLTTELDKQAALFGTLSDKIKDSWITTEKSALIHWTAMSEFAMISMQKLMDDWATTVEFVDSNVAYEQTISMSNGAAAATPISVPSITVPTLASVDFGKVSTLGGAGSGKNKNASEEKSGGAGVTVNVKVENETTVNSKITASVSDSMAQVIAVNGGTAGL